MTKRTPKPIAAASAPVITCHEDGEVFCAVDHRNGEVVIAHKSAVDSTILSADFALALFKCFQEKPIRELMARRWNQAMRATGSPAMIEALDLIDSQFAPIAPAPIAPAPHLTALRAQIDATTDPYTRQLLIFRMADLIFADFEATTPPASPEVIMEYRTDMVEPCTEFRCGGVILEFIDGQVEEPSVINFGSDYISLEKAEQEMRSFAAILADPRVQALRRGEALVLETAPLKGTK